MVNSKYIREMVTLIVYDVMVCNSYGGVVVASLQVICIVYSFTFHSNLTHLFTLYMHQSLNAVIIVIVFFFCVFLLFFFLFVYRLRYSMSKFTFVTL